MDRSSEYKSDVKMLREDRVERDFGGGLGLILFDINIMLHFNL